MGLPQAAALIYLMEQITKRSPARIEESTRALPQAAAHKRGAVAGGLLRAWSAVRPRTTLHAFRGHHSYEVQVGKIVVQVRHRGRRRTDWRRMSGDQYRPRRITAWIDTYGRWW